MAQRLTIAVPGGKDGETLSSQWGGLSDHLIARFYPVVRGNDGAWIKPQTEATVLAPLSEASMEVSLSWHSPFEAAGAEAKAPMLLAMVQSGQLQPLVNVLGSILGSGSGGIVDRIVSGISSTLDGMTGRTGITKLNSTQVFQGMPPIKIQVTALFRAWRDTDKEVEIPFNKLMEWALPVELSADGSIVQRAAMGKNPIDVLLPSKAPTCVAMRYKHRIYSPLVIESIGFPMASPVDRNSRFTELAIPMTLCTLTALDRSDWAAAGKL